MTNADRPDDLHDVDPSRADASLRGAPLTVRKAGAWLEAQKPHLRRRALAGYGALGLFFAAFPMAGIVATMTGSEPIGLAAMGLMIAGSTALGVANWRRWGRSTAWANAIVQRWKEIEELGLPADIAPDGEPTTTALDRMLARIETLAGPGREPVRDAAARAVERARRLEAELAHLDQVATGQPDADAAIDAAQERIRTELARTRARVAEVYAGLVDLEAGRDGDATEALEQALARVAAELEVQAPGRLPREAREGAAGTAPRGRPARDAEGN